MTKRWQVIFEVTLDIKGGDNQYVALERAKRAMDRIQGTEVAHYHVLQQPKVVVEFD